MKKLNDFIREHYDVGSVIVTEANYFMLDKATGEVNESKEFTGSVFDCNKTHESEIVTQKFAPTIEILKGDLIIALDELGLGK